MASIVADDALILPHRANPRGWNFREKQVAVPVPLQPLPIGVQIIAAPWREDVALRITHALEQAGIAAVTRPAVCAENLVRLI